MYIIIQSLTTIQLLKRLDMSAKQPLTLNMSCACSTRLCFVEQKSSSTSYSKADMKFKVTVIFFGGPWLSIVYTLSYTK